MFSTPITIDCTGVWKAYHQGGSVTPVLLGIDLIAHRGACIVLAGPSGSGKTTLLSIMGCILRADQGTVRILGHDVSDLSGRQLAAFRRDRIGFLFQRYHLIRGLSAVENVAVPLRLAGMQEREASKLAAAQLADVGLEDFLNKDPRQLSVGQCQRVALARAVINRPHLILADEPTASLDAASGRAAMLLIRRLVKEQNSTAIIVTHDRRVFGFGDKVLEMSGGRITGRMSWQHGDEAADTSETREVTVAAGREKLVGQIPNVGISSCE